MVPHQILCQLEARPIVGADHLLHDARRFQRGEVPVDGALGQLGSLGEQIGDGDRSAGSREQLDQFAAPRCVELVVAAQPRGGSFVHLAEVESNCHVDRLSC